MVEKQARATLTVYLGGTKARSVQDRGEVNRAKTVCSVSGRGRGANGRWRHSSMEDGDARWRRGDAEGRE